MQTAKTKQEALKPTSCKVQVGSHFLQVYFEQ